MEVESEDAASLSVLCWNIWFDSFARDLRLRLIFDQIDKTRPDVICLQEVLPCVVPIVVTQTWFSSYSASDDGSGDSVQPYGTLMLCRRELQPIFRFHDMPTDMCRRLLLAETVRGSCRLCVATVHLESLDNHDTREQQLEVCRKQLDPFENAILCGDFNFCSYRNYSGKGDLQNHSIAKILPEYEDMWPMLAPPEHRGYTFDSDLNPMIRQREQMRYDRILYRSKHLSPIQISMVGTLSALASGVMPLAEPRKEDPQRTPPRFKDYDNNSEQLYSADILRRIYPSDHFGLLSLFKLG
jgi:tyrosyl-DNA phosphodiesterase 2